MEHLFFWIVIFLLVAFNAVLVAFLYNQHKNRVSVEKEINKKNQEIGYLEVAMLDLKEENERYHKVNIKLNESNKELKKKLNNINVQIKNFTKNLKTN